MKFKVGDRVKVRRDLVVDKKYGTVTYFDFLDALVRNHDYILTVKDVHDGYSNKVYYVSEGGYGFTEEMFDNKVFRVGDKVRIKSHLTMLDTGIDSFFLNPMKDNVYTILSEGSVDSDGVQRHIILLEDRFGFSFKDSWLEEVEAEESSNTDEGDKEKFITWMKKLFEIDENDPDALKAFDRYYSPDSYKYGYSSLDKDLDIFWNYINKEEEKVKPMTLSEIEAELGFKVKIKE